MLMGRVFCSADGAGDRAGGGAAGRPALTTAPTTPDDSAPNKHRGPIDCVSACACVCVYLIRKSGLCVCVRVRPAACRRRSWRAQQVSSPNRSIVIVRRRRPVTGAMSGRRARRRQAPAGWPLCSAHSLRLAAAAAPSHSDRIIARCRTERVAASPSRRVNKCAPRAPN
jgi:hypothetical protein